MIAKHSDKICVQYKAYAEPLLLAGCEHIGERKCLTRSKYIRRCILRCLVADGYPLEQMSDKIGREINTLRRAIA